jgi:hypothetical protein
MTNKKDASNKFMFLMVGAILLIFIGALTIFGLLAANPSYEMGFLAIGVEVQLVGLVLIIMNRKTNKE